MYVLRKINLKNTIRVNFSVYKMWKCVLYYITFSIHHSVCYLLCNPYYNIIIVIKKKVISNNNENSRNVSIHRKS